MKSIKTAAAAAVLLATPLATTTAHAQTNVAIAGIVDACVAVSKGTEGSTVQINSGCAYGSRLIFRGEENLGGGLKANFSLESGFNIDSGQLGQNGRLFGRKALVGLSGRFGQIHMGRDYTPTFYLVQPVDPWKLGMGTASSTISTAARPDGLARNDNAIIYTSPVIGKVTVKAQYAAGETGTAYVHARDSKGVLVSYNDGKLLAGAVYNTHANATDAGNDRTMTIGASYKFAQVEPAFLYQVGKWEGSRTLAAPSLPSTFFSRDYTSFMVGATYRVAGTAGRFIGTFKRYNDKTVRNYDADQLTVGYKYNLSKRTELYTAVSRMANKNNAAFAVVDATTTYGPVNPGKNPSTMFAGITHNF